MTKINIDNFTNEEKELMCHVCRKRDKIPSESIYKLTHNNGMVNFNSKTINGLYIGLNNLIEKTNRSGNKIGHDEEMEYYYHRKKLDEIELAENLLNKLNKCKFSSS